jgi:hypothetical protein
MVTLLICPFIIIIIIRLYNRARFFVAPLIIIFNSRACEVAALRELRLKYNYLSHVSGSMLFICIYIFTTVYT